MGYFNLSCCSPTVSRIVLLILNIVVIGIGAAHLGCNFFLKKDASQFSTTKKASIAVTPTGADQAQALADPPMIYFIVGASIQILVSILVIIVLFEFLGKDNRLLWFRILAALIVASLAINFCMAVYASVITSYYKVMFDLSINLPDTTYALLTGIYKEAVDGQRNLYRYSIAEAIYTFIAAVPSITVILVALFNEFVNEGTANGSSKVAPGNQSSIQIDSFGNKQESVQNINPKK